MNTSDEVIQFVEQLLLKQLTYVERLVLSQSWLGHTYAEIGQSSDYTGEYIREVGSQLWQELSETLKQRVTKKNLSIVLKQHQLEIQAVSNDQKLPTSKCSLPSDVEFPSSPLPVGSPQYVNRTPIEELACAEISRPGCLVRIKAPAKMGKTSLLNRIIAHATDRQYKTVLINFLEAEATVFTCLDKFLRWLCANISRQLQLKLQLDEYWDEDMGSKVSCNIYLESYLLAEVNTPVVLALKEVNRVFEYPELATDFLPLLRSWHEMGQSGDIWQQLRLVIVHSTEIYVPLKLNQSPFNLGLTLKLPPFNLEQVQELAVRYQLDWQNEAGINYASSLLALVGGHPYLLSLALYYLGQGEMDLEELLHSAPTTAGIYSHYLRSHLVVIQEHPQLTSALRQVIAADELPLDAVTAYKLESMGLIQLDGNAARVSCELYRIYFRSQLGGENYLVPSQLQLEQPEQQYVNNIEELVHLAETSYFNRCLASKLDELTHLANQSYFNQYLEAASQQLSQEEAAFISLILCQIDEVEGFSSRHELSAADLCLQLIGSTILECVSKQIACVARYEEQKFGVILPRTDAETATAIADNIQSSIEALAIEPHSSESSLLLRASPIVSVGVATISPSSTTSPAMLLTAAEDSLAQAQRYKCYGITTNPTVNVKQCQR